MEIDDAALPIHQDATLEDPPAHLPRGQLLRRPQARHAVGAGGAESGTIGSTQTATPVQLDELLTALQSDTRADLQTVLQRVRQGARLEADRGRGRDAGPDVRGLTGAQGAQQGSTPTAPDALKGTTLVNSALLGTSRTTSRA